MRTKSVLTSILMIGMSVLAAACGASNSSGNEKVIKSTKTADMTVSIASPTGELKNGDNELMIIFNDASGTLVDVGAASLVFHMAGMGAMPEMNDKATLTTTDTPGKYRAQVNIEMAGTWEARIRYQGDHGTGQVSMTVQAK